MEAPFTNIKFKKKEKYSTRKPPPLSPPSCCTRPSKLLDHELDSLSGKRGLQGWKKFSSEEWKWCCRRKGVGWVEGKMWFSALSLCMWILRHSFEHTNTHTHVPVPIRWQQSKCEQTSETDKEWRKCWRCYELWMNNFEWGRTAWVGKVLCGS